MSKEIQLVTNETVIELINAQKESNKIIKSMFFGLLALAITLIICFSTLYILDNYNIEASTTTTTTTEQNVEGDNTSIINGDQFNDNSNKNR